MAVDPALPALALVAGAVAAFNPCGFALLPAYLSLLVAPPAGDAALTRGARLAAVGRAARFTSGMTAGFVGVFGLFGLLVSAVTAPLERYLPVVTVGIGAALVPLGVWLIAGRSLALPGLARAGRAPTTTWWSQVGYGVTFAVASLSCTVAPFLAVTAGAVGGGSAVEVAAAFTAYAAGMGAVVGVLALAATTAGAGLALRLRRASAVIARFSGALLVLAGGYVAWYGWFELRVLSGATTGDPVVAAAIRVQSAIARAVAAAGAPAIGLAAAAVTVIIAIAAVQRRRRASRQGSPRREAVGTGGVRVAEQGGRR